MDVHVHHHVQENHGNIYRNVPTNGPDVLNVLEQTLDLIPVYKGASRKRRSKRKGKPKSPRGLHIKQTNSECSDSSSECAGNKKKDVRETMTSPDQSDSDEMAVVRRLTSLNVSSLVESDSFTEGHCVIHRKRNKRRRHKAMKMCLDHHHHRTTPHTPLVNIRKLPTKDGAVMETSFELNDVEMLENKFRSVLERTGDVAGGVSGPGCSDFHMEMSDCSEDESDGSESSSTSDPGLFTTDEARDGDDEHSEYSDTDEQFPGVSDCAIPGIIPWWDERNLDDYLDEKKFRQILNGAFPLLPETSQKVLTRKLNNDLTIDEGPRKLSNKRQPTVDLSPHVHDFPKRWQSCCCSAADLSMVETAGVLHKVPAANRHSPYITKHKRRPPKKRRKLPCVGGIEGPSDETGLPIPASNIGNKILQRMGWVPGTGLGLEKNGIAEPVLPSILPKRQGLGY